MVCRWRRTVSASVAGSNGLAITAAAPSAFISSISSALPRAVVKISGNFAVAGFARNARSSASPSMSGIMTSHRINSGAQSITTASASCALAELISMNAGSRPSAISTTSRISGSSST